MNDQEYVPNPCQISWNACSSKMQSELKFIDDVRTGQIPQNNSRAQEQRMFKVVVER